MGPTLHSIRDIRLADLGTDSSGRIRDPSLRFADASALSCVSPENPGEPCVTATGLLLIRVADPKQRTEARQAYSEKQPFYEPFMGGGLVTAFAVPIPAGIGAGGALGIAAGILGLWIGYAVLLARRT